MRFLQSLTPMLATLLLSTPTSSAPLTYSNAFPARAVVQPRTVLQFSNPTWLENLAPTRNGSLLASVIGRPEVLFIPNPTLSPPTSSILATFPNRTAAFGITEYAPDVFAVAVGSTTPDTQPVAGTYGIWSIDLSGKSGGGVVVRKITDTPNVGLLNGLLTLNPTTLLAADSWTGNIVKIDIKTGAYGVGLSHPTLASDFSAPGLPLGVNGIRIHGDYLYYSNTVQRLLGRVKVDKKTGKAVGGWQVIAQGEVISVPDDFAVAKDGSVYLASPVAAPQGDTLQHVYLDGRVELVANVEGPTSAQFGKGKGDKNVLYLSTMGGFDANGVPKAGGSIVAVKV